MPKVTITEFASPVTSDGLATFPPAVAQPTLTPGGAAVPSAVFAAGSKSVRIATDTACHVAIGVNAVADVNSALWPAGHVEYVSPSASGMRVSVLAA